MNTQATVVTLPIVVSDRATCVQCGWSNGSNDYRTSARFHAAHRGHRVTLTHIVIEQVEVTQQDRKGE